MSRVYLCDAPAISHWMYHAADKSAGGLDETPLDDRIERWWSEFRDAMNPQRFVACFDGRGSWRQSLSADYKSARKAKPVDPKKIEALRSVPTLWRSFGVPVVSADQYESDDCIATLTARFCSPDNEVYIITSDKDLSALVGDMNGGRVSVYDPRPDKTGECKTYDAEAVYQKHGVRPHRLQDLLAIMGDASDSIAGIKGIGRVNAVNAINQTKSAAEIFRKAAKGELANITPANQAKIVAGRDDFDLSLKLVTLRYDAPIDLTIDDAAIAPWFPRVDEQAIADGAQAASEKP